MDLAQTKTETRNIEALEAKFNVASGDWLLFPFTHSAGEEIYEVTATICQKAGTSGCGINPAIEIEFYHPSTGGESERVLFSETIRNYLFDEAIRIRKPSGTSGYMRPLFFRMRMAAQDDPSCLGDMILTVLFGRA